MGQDRYAKIEELISSLEPRDEFVIIEVGVWNGGRAMRMAEAAFKIAKRVKYFGYDLFEQATPDINLRELNAKPNQTVEHVADRLTWFKAKKPGFEFALIPGNTNETLKGAALIADFVYIDGGHSVETIANDYAAFKECPLVVFDDYYLGLDEETLDRVGANRTVDVLANVEIIDTGDVLYTGDVQGTVALAVVRSKPIEEGLAPGVAELEERREKIEADAESMRASPRPKRTPRKKSMAAAERRKNMEPPFRDE